MAIDRTSQGDIYLGAVNFEFDDITKITTLANNVTVGPNSTSSVIVPAAAPGWMWGEAVRQCRRGE
ncbi:MAG: hypothetical protein ABSH20_31870 [Tepidisphaeraceae bacterium]|jgi:hypothetical protein